jgi:hypothetical protein
LPSPQQTLCLGPLLSRASVHANTAGVFKGFYKDRRTGLGRFGGTHGDALQRILGEIRLDAPVLSRFECDVEVMQDDANAVVERVRDLDLASTRRNQRMSNFHAQSLVGYVRPVAISRVRFGRLDAVAAGEGWRRALGQLLRADALPARVFNDEILSGVGRDAPSAWSRRRDRAAPPRRGMQPSHRRIHVNSCFWSNASGRIARPFLPRS